MGLTGLFTGEFSRNHPTQGRILMVEPAIIIPKYGKINIWGWVNFLSPVEPWHHRLEWINMINV